MHEASLAGLSSGGSWSWALASLMLLALLVSRTKGEGPGVALLAAVSLEVMLAAAYAVFGATPLRGEWLPALLESSRSLCWMWFLLWLMLGGKSRTNRALWVAMSGSHRSCTLAIGSLCVVTAVSDLRMFGSDASFTLHMVNVIVLLIGLEMVWRNTADADRRALKFICLALLSKFSFELLLYSDALLFGRVDGALWAARGFVNALLVPLIAVSAARNPRWKLDLSVSRQMVFHSTALLGSGAFLFTLALGGYYLKIFGGSSGSVAAAIIGFAGLLALLLLLTSETARAWLRVHISKHFFSYRYDYREQWLQFTRSLTLATRNPSGRSGLSNGEDSLPTTALSALAALVDRRRGALWVKAADGRLRCEASTGWKERPPDFADDEPVLRWLQDRDWILDTEGDADQSAAAHPRPPDWLLTGAFRGLLVPLILDRELVGVALLQVPRANICFDWQLRDLLKTAARQAASYLALDLTVAELMQARQFEHFNRRSAFVAHDLKNLVAQLSLLLKNAARHKENPQFQEDVLETMQNVHGRMIALLLHVHTGETPIDGPSHVLVSKVIDAALDSGVGKISTTRLHIDPNINDAEVTADPRKLERMLGHLLQNAAEATTAGGCVSVNASRCQRHVLIEIADDGVGMSESFVRNQLFRPFVSTKKDGMGIGAFETREYVQELDGSVEVASAPSQGTRFSIRLPLRHTSA